MYIALKGEGARFATLALLILPKLPCTDPSWQVVLPFGLEQLARQTAVDDAAAGVLSKAKGLGIAGHYALACASRALI